MSKFNIYIIKEIVFSFLLLTTLLTGILWLGQGLRHIDLLTSDNISFVSYLSYIVMLIPKITTLTIPVSLFFIVELYTVGLASDATLHPAHSTNFKSDLKFICHVFTSS